MGMQQCHFQSAHGFFVAKDVSKYTNNTVVCRVLCYGVGRDPFAKRGVLREDVNDFAVNLAAYWSCSAGLYSQSAGQ